MANNKSAKKRIKITKRNCTQNKYYTTSVKTLIKSFFTDLEKYKHSPKLEKKKKLQETLNLIYSFLDKGTKKNVFHKNTTARQKSKLANYLKPLLS